MELRGIIEIYGMRLNATMRLEPYNDARAYITPAGKWRAYKTINGKQHAFGTHDTQAQALEAARLGVKPTTRQDATSGVHQRGENGMWRAMLTIGGVRVRLGEYATRGHALLVRDVVARRAGLPVIVADYEMPLGLVSHPVARSYIRDAVTAPTADELARYGARVDDLNRRA